MDSTKKIEGPSQASSPTKNFVDGEREPTRHLVDTPPAPAPSPLEQAAPATEVLDVADVTDDGLDIKIEELTTAFRLTIPKRYLERTDSHRLGQLIRLATSPLFMPLPSEKQYLNYGPERKARSCGIWMEQMAHYTGGRYSMYLLGVVLSQFMDVTIVTNMPAPFEGDFSDYDLSQFQRVVDTRWGMDVSENTFDFVVGVPNIGGQFAKSYAERFGIPCYLVLFESPNFKRETYPDGRDATEDYWADYKKCLRTCDGIVSPSEVSSAKAQEWLPDYKGPWFVLRPGINQLVADAALASVANPVFAEGEDGTEVRELARIEPDRNHHELIFCARMVEFKNPVRVFDELARVLDRPAHVTVLGKVGPAALAQIAAKQAAWQAADLDVEVRGVVDDRDKFEAIKRADLMLFPSRFEGFGMPPEEALYMHTPCVAYDLPVLRSSYGDGLLYAPLGDPRAFAEKVAWALDEANEFEVDLSVAKGRARILDWCTAEAQAEKALEIFQVGGRGPRLSVGMIVFNGDTYITEALDGVYDLAHEIIIVEGAVRGMWEHANGRGSSTDATLQKIAGYPDPDHKITLVTPSPDHRWEDKVEMQNEIAKRVTGDVYLKLDSDEVWDPRDVARIVKMFEDDPELSVVRVGFHHFWTNFETVAVGCPQWESKIPRFWRWRHGFHHSASFNYFVDANGVPVKSENGYKELVVPDKLVYHFGYVQQVEKVRAKLGYYAGRGIERNVEDRYSNWQPGEETQPTTGGGTAEPFRGSLPPGLVAHQFYGVEDVREL